MNGLSIAENLIRLRHERKITQIELADFMGVTKASVSKWESGKSIPDILLLPQLAAFFGVTVDELLGYEAQLSPEQIRKIYGDLCEGFTRLPFGEALDAARMYAHRYYIVAAKTLMLMGMWTVLYMLCFCVTYGYNAYFWDNRIAEHLPFAAICYWLFGIWVLALLVFFSSAAKTNIQVLLGTGGVTFGIYLTGMFPKVSHFLPAKLMEGMALLQGTAKPEDYIAAIGTAAVTTALAIALSLECFDRRQLSE